MRPDPRVSAPLLMRDLVALFPALAGTRISHSWNGFVAYTFDHLPHLGQKRWRLLRRRLLRFGSRLGELLRHQGGTENAWFGRGANRFGRSNQSHAALLLRPAVVLGRHRRLLPMARQAGFRRATSVTRLAGFSFF